MELNCKIFLDKTKVGIKIFCPVLFSSHHYPSMAGALTVFTVSSYLGLFIQSLQLLLGRLSLIADFVSISCSVGLLCCVVVVF